MLLRNAYAVPAKFRNNAGVHVHKNPPRLRFEAKGDIIMECKNCMYYVKEGKDYDGNSVSNYCELYGVPYIQDCPANEDCMPFIQGDNDNE